MPFDQENFGLPDLSVPVIAPSMPEGHRRLLVLAEFLETEVSPERFDMMVFAGEERSCGTSACALGWACSIPEFRAAGLYIERYRPQLRGDLTCDAFQVGERFFGVSIDDSHKLFTPDAALTGPDLETPAQVAARLRTFVSQQSVTK